MAIKYKLPKGWEDITVPQLIELERIQKADVGDFMPSLVKTYQILSLLTGYPYEHFEAMKISEAKELAEKIAFLNDYPEDQAVQYFWCGGYRWKMNFNINNLTGGQLIDHYELTKDQDRILANCNKLMALYCEPKKWFFFKKDMSYEDKQAILLDAPVKVVYPLTLFFCRLYPHLLNAIKDYLQKQEQLMKKELERMIR